MSTEWEKNVQSNPEASGLKILGSLSEPDLSYEFNDLIVWKHTATGRVFYATDSGCSCPTPFEKEHFNGPDATSLTEIKLGDSFTSFEREVASFCTEEYDGHIPQSEKDELVLIVRRALKEARS